MSPPRRRRIAVLFGGRSAEHEVSCVSARSVREALDPERFEPVFIGITKEDEAIVKEFVKDFPIQYFIGRDPSAELAGHLGVTVMPHAIIVNRSGKITWEGHPETVQPGDIEDALK